MDAGAIEMGPRYGYHGTYTFYKAFRYWVRGRWRTVSMEKFFFVNSSSSSKDSSLCIGEIQLIWTVKSEPQEPLSSLRLYFMPERSPGGRQLHHGQDELLAAENKIIIRVKDLISWLAVENVPWIGGSVLPAHLCDAHQSTHPVECPIVIISYPKYCRLIAMKKQLESAMSSATTSNSNTLSAVFSAALRTMCSINTDLTSQTRIMFCRDTFGHPDLDDHKLRCDHLAPNLKGRPRSKHRGPLKTAADTEYVPLNSVPAKPKRGRPRKGVISEAILRAEGPFLKAIYSFMKDRGTPIHRIPSLGFKKVDLYAFYKTAEKLGGYKQICSKRMWKVLHDKIGGNPGSTSAATCTRKHYERLLLPFEEHLRSAGSSSRSASVAASSNSKASSGFSQSLHKPKALPAQPSTFADHRTAAAASAARQQQLLPHAAGQCLAKDGGGASTGSQGVAEGTTDTSQGGRVVAEHQQRQPAKRQHAAVLSTVTSGQQDGSRGGITAPDVWPMTCHAITTPPLPGGAAAPGSEHDRSGRQPGERQLLEAVLRTASMPAGSLLPATTSGKQQQQQRHHLLHHYHPHGGGAVGSGDRAPSSDGRVLLTTATGQLLAAATREQLLTASSSSLIFGRHKGMELPRPRRPEASLADAHGRALAWPQQHQLVLVAAPATTVGCTASQSGLPLPYFSTAERRAQRPDAQSAKRSRLGAAAAVATVADGSCRAVRAGHQRQAGFGGAGSDVPLDLTCKAAPRAVTTTPLQPAVVASLLGRGRSPPRKQHQSKEQEAVVVAPAAGRSAYSASGAPFYLSSQSDGGSGGPCLKPGGLPTLAAAMAATLYSPYVSSSPKPVISAPKPSHQPLDSYQLGLGDCTASLQQVASRTACSSGGSAAGDQLADASVQASAARLTASLGGCSTVARVATTSPAAPPALQMAITALPQGKPFAPLTMQHYVHSPPTHPYSKQH